jgi:hypothetical protein
VRLAGCAAASTQPRLTPTRSRCRAIEPDTEVFLNASRCLGSIECQAHILRHDLWSIADFEYGGESDPLVTDLVVRSARQGFDGRAEPRERLDSLGVERPTFVRDYEGGVCDHESNVPTRLGVNHCVVGVLQ